jgi:hypothetical protein
MDSVRDLARRAIWASKERSLTYTGLICVVHEITMELAGQISDPVEVAQHPISQLLAHKIRNIACPDSSHTLRRAEIQVERLAEVNDGSDEEGCGAAICGQAAATHAGGTDSIPLSLREKLERGKRLRG